MQNFSHEDHPPKYGYSSFDCSHCLVRSQHIWFSVCVSQISHFGLVHEMEKFNEDKRMYKDDVEGFYDDSEYFESEEKIFEEHLNFNHLHLSKNQIEPEEVKKMDFLSMKNFKISECTNCRRLSLWKFDELIYPKFGKIPKHPDMPTKVGKIFDEANKIFNDSPRGASALLRLALEMLLTHLKIKGQSIDLKIKNLANNGIDPKLQKALNIVRVTGNEAVHPGQIDFDDNQEVARTLFEIVNLIVDEMITRPKNIDNAFENLPQKGTVTTKKMQ